MAPIESEDPSSPEFAPRAARLDAGAGDWEAMFIAVERTLRLNLAEWLAEAPVPAPRSKADLARTHLVECSAALEQLRQTLTTAVERHRQLEAEVAAVRAALACARTGEARALHLATHDELTSLPNRIFFRARLDEAIAIARAPHDSIAVLYLDLDGFKSINDAHGHDTGDEVLRIVAARLSRTVRAGDVVSRIGGDEFACLLAGLPTREHLSQIAGKLLDAVAAPLTIGAVTTVVRPSIGISLWAADGLTADALLRSADAAMYRAKRQKCGLAFVGDPAGAREQDAA